MNIVASIQARLGSTRLPGKVLFHLGNRRLLQWVVDRTEATDHVDETVVTTGDELENDAVREYCERSEITCMTGPEENLLARHHAVADRTNCDLLVRITADCPFVPSAEIDRLIEAHQANGAQYTTNNTDKMPIGTAVDIIDPSLLTVFESLGATHPVNLAHTNPDRWKTAWTDNSSWYDVSDAHIAVDTPADYWSLTDAVAAVGSEPYAVAEWVLE
jgi:spore coat polysaccharide biosynthesis protein SpsF